MTQKALNTKDHILATGRRLTALHGYTGVGLSELLKAAGVPKGSFYHYFASKEAYGCALLEAFVADYKERLGATLANPDIDGRTRFLNYFRDWHRRQSSGDPMDRCLVVKLSAEVADLSTDMSAILDRGVTAIIAQLTRTLEQGIADGSIVPMADPAGTAQSIYHQWLGASLVASLSQNDGALTSTLLMTETLIPKP
ncbi:TetR/AcrR family transcriptional regulator [Celeribacter sp.]|uniref:TetR/AcrR family transcriptional regulator n=1 Tax=Celeribacter sp. TaxID=1890673 RepID=UPI003A916943